MPSVFFQPHDIVDRVDLCDGGSHADARATLRQILGYIVRIWENALPRRRPNAVKDFASQSMDIVSAFQAFSVRETALTGGSRTPARVVSAHSGLFSPWGILHGVGRRPLVPNLP